jgi:hypothetical protein
MNEVEDIDAGLYATRDTLYVQGMAFRVAKTQNCPRRLHSIGKTNTLRLSAIQTKLAERTSSHNAKQFTTTLVRLGVRR